jgi:hypothetical protein
MPIGGKCIGRLQSQSSHKSGQLYPTVGAASRAVPMMAAVQVPRFRRGAHRFVAKSDNAASLFHRIME